MTRVITVIIVNYLFLVSRLISNYIRSWQVFALGTSSARKHKFLAREVFCVKTSF